ncbi:MAG: amino acid adenylation domain-containing protein, partial [Methylomarinum sp.]|nr:amino acid adenylation domain-containing protein [Methylomarinum sp.]
MSTLNSRIKNLSKEKQALLSMRLKEQKTNIKNSIKKNETAEKPLSFAQERLWFLAQMDPDNPFYNVASAIRISGLLNTVLLQQCINELVYRHEVFRTTFEAEGGHAKSTVIDSVETKIHMTDLGGLSELKLKLEIEQLKTIEAQKPFNLLKAPMIRTRLLVLSPEESILLLTMHHIVSDEWSLGIIIQEVSDLYLTYMTGTPSDLQKLAIQYSDFCYWQRSFLNEKKLQQQLNYWKQLLQSTPWVLELPCDNIRPLEQSFQGGIYSLTLPESLSIAIVNLSKEQNVTLFMMLLTAFNVLLHRYTGQNEICIGYPAANRNRAEIEKMIGFFVNTLVMPANLSGNPKYTALLQQIRTHLMDAQKYQDLPFEQLVEALNPDRTLSRHPIFQVMFAFQTLHVDFNIKTGLHFQQEELETKTSKFDLTLLAVQQEKEIICHFEYSTDLFDESSIIIMAKYFETLLYSIVHQPQSHISELPVLTQVDKQQILVDWNATQVDFSQEKYIHQLIEDQVQRTPNSIAVVFADQSMTYVELNNKANQLAHYLKAQGVGPDVLVGILMERSLEMVIGLLGIMKAGGAYVPLDPDYPKDRLDFMLHDIDPPIILTQKALRKKFKENTIEVFCLDMDWVELTKETSDNLKVALLPENLAYCIYTSGSTGQPKGTGIPHKGILNRLQWMQEQYQLSPIDRVLQKTPYSFDVSVWEFFWPLMVGARLVVAKPGEHKDSQGLINTIRQQKITILHFVPSMLNVFIDTPGVENCTSIKHVICSGEALLVGLVSQFYQKSRAKLHNLYGPTEASIDVSAWTCKKDLTKKIIPIGKPIANMSLYILDQRFNPVPVGATGELFIGGIGLSRGYINRAELTAEQFIPHPFVSDGSRIYKTGDLVRYQQDGNIEYLDRIDYQVKIRGFRVELGEIEAKLLAYPDIKETAVTVGESSSGNKYLVAYYVTSQSNSVNVEILKEFLKEKLPDYMVPTAFMSVAEMPLSANGKLDRKRLPALDFNEENKRQYLAPRTDTEEILVDIWSQLLGIKQIGIHDNFFELGGDSILSIQVVSRARQAGIVITPRQLFQNQTIESLAIEANKGNTIQSEQGQVNGSVPLMPIQRWFFEQQLANPNHWNQALFFEAKGGGGAEILHHAVKHLLIHHDALRLRFSQKQEKWQQYNLKDEDETFFTHIDLSTVPSELQALEQVSITSKMQSNLGLTNGPLLRVVWFNYGQHINSRVLIVIHHLVIDGVSWRILLEDLMSICHQLQTDQKVVLPAKTTSFKQWAEQIISQVRSGSVSLNKEYWLNSLRQKVPSLPVDFPDGGRSFATENSVTLLLTELETHALLHEVSAAYRTTTEELLLSALALTLVEWTQYKTLLIDMEGHGREEIVNDLDVSRTVGWFTSLFPLLLNLPINTSLSDTVQMIKEQLRSVPQKGISYGLLRYLTKDPDIVDQLALFPQAQILWNYLGQLDAVIKEDALLKPILDKVGENCDSANVRSHELEIISSISEGRFQVSWSYSGERYCKDTIERLAENYLQHLNALITHCLLPDTGAYTPSDFPLISLKQTDLDILNLPPRQIEDVYPLAPLQHGLIFHSLYTPDSGVYCIQLGCHLQGQLDVPVFKQAWQLVINRHPILRTRFQLENQDTPVQIVHKHVQLPITEFDWCDFPKQEHEIRWRKLLKEDQKTGFDFTHVPLMRLGLVRCSELSHYFFWSHHHVLLDGWSNPLILKEVFVVYGTLIQGHKPVLPVVRPYRDYISWLQCQDVAASEVYWKEILNGFKAPTSLSIEKPTIVSAHTEQLVYANELLSVSAEQTFALQNFAKQHQLTLNTLVQGAWALLLSKYSGERDIVFGATTAGRSAELNGIETMVGLFINTLPIRVKILPKCSTIDWLKKLFVQNQKSHSYEHTPLVKIQGWSDIPHGLSLFKSLLVFENYPIDQALMQTVADLEVNDINVVDQTSYPLTISVYPGSEIKLNISYDKSLFDAKAISIMLVHLDNLFRVFVNNPNSRVSELSLLTQQETQQILVNWNKTTINFPQKYFIHQMFEEQVNKTPSAIALVFEDNALTYEELNCKSNQLAYYLQEKGVGPDVLVGLCIKRSLEMVIGLLGILKAGGAYVPLDPDYPQERLDFISHDINPLIILTQDVLQEKFVGNKTQV